MTNTAPATQSPFYVNYNDATADPASTWQGSTSAYSGYTDLDQWELAARYSKPMEFTVTGSDSSTYFVWARDPTDSGGTLYGFKLTPNVQATDGVAPAGGGSIYIKQILEVQANILISDDPKVKLTSSNSGANASGGTLELCWDAGGNSWTYTDTSGGQASVTSAPINYYNTRNPFTVKVKIKDDASSGKYNVALYSVVGDNPDNPAGIIFQDQYGISQGRDANLSVTVNQIQSSDQQFTVNLFQPASDSCQTVGG